MTLFLLFLAGMFAGTVDAIAGGGGLISLPVLIATGMPPHLAFGTNKLQGMSGTFVAALKYYRHGYVTLSSITTGALFALLGGVLGSLASQWLSNELLKDIVPFLLILIFLYTFFSPRIGIEDKSPRINSLWFYATFGTMIGFYDGFFGPGTGSFWVIALSFFMGFNLIKATAYTKVFNLMSSVSAMLCFAVFGNVDYYLGGAMVLGQVIGGQLGAHLAIRNGAKLIRPLFMAMVSLTIATLVYKRMESYQFIQVFALQQHPAVWVGGISVALVTMMFAYFKLQKR